MSTPVSRDQAPQKSTYVIEKELKKSLEVTDTALKQFLQSLEKAGMAEGLSGYRSLQVLLVQQRLWAQSHGRAQLTPLFRSIAKTAADLHRIFSAYTESMRTLKDLERLKGMPLSGAVSGLGLPPQKGGEEEKHDG
jgi:hypothetical protein